MARPSKKTERTEDILNAFERCAARFGIEGATLERVAAEAGLQRSLLRHYVGNRDDLINAMLERFLARSEREVDNLFESLPATNRATALINRLFDYPGDTHFAQVAQALILAAPNYENLRPALRRWSLDFTQRIAAELESDCGASKQDAYEVAAGIVGIYFNVESISPLGRMTKLCTASKKAATRLISSLQ